MTDDCRKLSEEERIKIYLDARNALDRMEPVCPNCWSTDLAKIKACVRCLTCGFKEDCNGF